MESIKCPSCSGEMEYNPDKQLAVCKYCGTTTNIKPEVDQSIKEYDFNEFENVDYSDWGNDQRVVQCSGCGAQIVIEKDQITNYCSYCGNQAFIDINAVPGIKPESLIPFKITKQEVEEKFKSWIKSRWLAPNDLKNTLINDKLNGMYTPFWTYDANTTTKYSMEAGKYRYKSKESYRYENGQKVSYTENERYTEWHNESGTHSESFNDVLVNASQQLTDQELSKIEPFQLDHLVPYSKDFITGFQCEKNKSGVKEGFEGAKRIIENRIRNSISKKVLADEVRNFNTYTDYTNIKFKQVLLPIWISAYRYKDKIYRYMVNGQTGEVIGESPISKAKAAILGAIGLSILAAFTILYFTYLKK